MRMMIVRCRVSRRVSVNDPSVWVVKSFFEQDTSIMANLVSHRYTESRDLRALFKEIKKCYRKLGVLIISQANGAQNLETSGGGSAPPFGCFSRLKKF
jgi:hypothetical protein